MVLIVDSDVFVAELTFAEIISLRGIPMSLGGLVDKILVYRSCSHRFDPSYGTSFFFFFLICLTTPIHIYAYLVCKGLMHNISLVLHLKLMLQKGCYC